MLGKFSKCIKRHKYIKYTIFGILAVCMYVCMLSYVRLCDPKDYSQPGFSVHGFPGVLVVKNLPTKVRDACLILGLGRYPGGKYHGQKGGWCATVHAIKKVGHELATEHARILRPVPHHCIDHYKG